MDNNSHNSKQQEFRKAIALVLTSKFDDLSAIRPNINTSMGRKICDMALNQNVNLEQNPDMVRHLSKLEEMRIIPESLYPVVADILVKMSKLEDSKRRAN